MESAVAITPQGVRNGHPQVLAALVARRGPAVLAHARCVVDEGLVVRAAADAFARFRAAVVAGDVREHPDALLLRCARRAALDLAPPGPDLGCLPARELFASRAEKTIKPGAAALLDRHAASCEHCAALADRLERGEDAYRDADEVPLEPAVVAPIVAALAAAAPVAPSAIAPATNGAPKPVLSAVPEPAPAAPVLAAVPEPEPSPPLAAVEDAAPEAAAAEDEDLGAAADPAAGLADDEDEPGDLADDAIAADDDLAAADLAAGDVPEPQDAPDDHDHADHDRVAPLPYYQVPEPAPSSRAERRRKAAARAAAAGGAAAALTRRARKAARERLDRRAETPPEAPQTPEAPEAPQIPDAPQAPEPVSLVAAPSPPAPDLGFAPDDTIIWPAASPTAEPVETVSDEPPLRGVDDELEQSAARAAARHYRRLRHRAQREESIPDGPPRFPRPPRPRPHLPLRSHGRRELALPAGLLVLAALVIMAVAGVFGGGSATPETGTLARRAPVPPLVSQSVTSMSLERAVEIAAARPATSSTATTP